MATVILSREEKGRLIAESPNQITREDEWFYKVASQSGHGIYNVTKKENGSWICTCPDHIYRTRRILQDERSQMNQLHANRSSIVQTLGDIVNPFLLHHFSRFERSHRTSLLY